jgi:hypothetical protein
LSAAASASADCARSSLVCCLARFACEASIRLSTAASRHTS